MVHLRRLVPLVALGLVLGVSAASAARPTTLPQVVNSTHFVVHYNSSTTTQSTAQDLSSTAENAYDEVVTTLGFAPPLSDGSLGGDGRIDIYLGTGGPGTTAGLYGGTIFSDSGTFSGPFYIELDPGADPSQLLPGALAMLAIDYTWPWFSSAWFSEAVAQWASMSALGYPLVDADALGPWDTSLDCEELLPTPSGNCANRGDSRWPFAEFLAERFGTGFVAGLFADAKANSQANVMTELTNAIAAKGDSFTNVFNAWAVANMVGGYTPKSLQVIKPTVSGEPIPTGTLATLNQGQPLQAPLVLSGPIPTTTVTVGHLATKYVALEPGDGASTGTCFAASLALSVTVPAGSGSAPAFWWSDVPPGGAKQAAQTLSVNGSTATITVPWDTCNWGTTYGYLSLPNPSANDGQSFKVSGTLTVDPAQPAVATDPPLGPKLPSVVIAAPTAAVTPTVDLFGPQTIHVSSATAQLRLVLASSGPGLADVKLGATDLGTLPLRAGNDDLRFTLGAGVLQALTNAGAAGLPLALTPQSTLGVPGIVSTRQVVLDSSPQAQAKTKTKPKAKKTKHGSAKRRTRR